MKRLWLRIPRPWRALLNSLAILILAAAFYVSIDAPTLTKVHSLRRQERANLIGPSKIHFSREVENYNFGHIMMSETDYGVITWVDDITFGFNYHEKTGDLTVVTGPKWWFHWGSNRFETSLPIFLVDDHPEAVRAELELNITGFFEHNTNGQLCREPLDHHFSLEAQREEENYFFFTIDLPYIEQDYSDPGAEDVNHEGPGYALDELASHFTDLISNPQSSTSSITATVRLYDEQNNLIVTRDMVLRAMAEE